MYLLLEQIVLNDAEFNKILNIHTHTDTKTNLRKQPIAHLCDCALLVLFRMSSMSMYCILS